MSHSEMPVSPISVPVLGQFLMFLAFSRERAAGGRVEDSLMSR